MSCPRCGHDALTTLANSPDPGIWQVYECLLCLYTWRSTEPVRRTRREHYPEQFRLTPADVENARHVPTVPPLRGEA